jgi:hypothetical protein
MKKSPTDVAGGEPTVSRLTFPFDRLMCEMPSNIQIRLGPGTYLTRGFAPNDSRGWQPKTGQKIIGAGTVVTTLQLVGAENADQHYHLIGMPIEPSSTTPIAPLESFEVSDLTLDANLEDQPGRTDPGYAPVACGAVRVFGHQCRVSRVRTINWGTRSLKQGCFVISILQASGKPTVNGNPIITEKDHCGIEDCIAIQPSQSCARETTVLHIGGLKNSENHAQGFGRGPFIRRNFVDGQFHSTPNPDVIPAIPSVPYPSFFSTSKSGTQITGSTGTFVGKRPHFRIGLDVGTFVRFYNPNNPLSRWNGYFPITALGATDDTLLIGLASSTGTNDDSSLVIMGTEFRGIAVSSCVSAVVEQNQIHNCWIGGPYSSPMDDSVTQPTSPPTLAREEHLDPGNALNIRSQIVRLNSYWNTVAGPYWNMGGLSAPVSGSSISYAATTGLVTVTTASQHKLWVKARVKIESTPDGRYEGLQEITDIADGMHFKYQLAANLQNMASGSAQYRVVSGADFLLIDGNVIELADLDETEFAIKEYVLGASVLGPIYRARGIIVGDNWLSARGGPYAHGQVIVRKNKIRFVDGQLAATREGIGIPAGSGIQITGAKQVHLTNNVVEVNARNPVQIFRCGKVYVFNNESSGKRVGDFERQSSI